MDISQIRSLLSEWFQPSDDPRRLNADEDYTEAREAMRALKSLFEQELGHRAQMFGKARAPHDGQE